MTAIGPGSLVRCVDDIPLDGDPKMLEAGCIYEVACITPKCCAGQEDGYILRGVVEPVVLFECPCCGHREIAKIGFLASRFTPIDDSAIDIFRRLAEPLKDKAAAE